MKRSPIEKYTISLHENIFEKILGMLFIQKLKPALNKAAKELEDDAEFQAAIQGMQYHRDQLERKLKHWCKYYPDDAMCKESARRKAMKR